MSHTGATEGIARQTTHPSLIWKGTLAPSRAISVPKPQVTNLVDTPALVESITLPLLHTAHIEHPDADGGPTLEVLGLRLTTTTRL